MTFSRHPLPLRLLLPVAALLLQACSTSNPVVELPPGIEQQRIDELQQAILSLDPSVDRNEARRAATIAIEYPQELALRYDVTDPPLVHNMKVNLGVKQRGLCVDWTFDLTERLQKEGFHSLELHWGIANYQHLLRIEHSTVIITARGQPMQDGLVLDPWRNSGYLFWSKTSEDPEYRWYPQAEIHALKDDSGELAQAER